MVEFEAGTVTSEIISVRQALDATVDLGRFALNIVRALDEAPGSSLTASHVTCTEALDLVVGYPGTASHATDEEALYLSPPTRRTLHALLQTSNEPLLRHNATNPSLLKLNQSFVDSQHHVPGAT